MTTVEKHFGGPSKTLGQLCDLAIALPGIHAEGLKSAPQRDACTPTFTAAFFPIKEDLETTYMLISRQTGKGHGHTHRTECH